MGFYIQNRFLQSLSELSTENICRNGKQDLFLANSESVSLKGLETFCEAGMMAIMKTKKNNPESEKRVCLICGEPEKARLLCSTHLRRFETAKKAFAEKTGLDPDIYDKRAVAAKKIAPKQSGGRPRKEMPGKKPDTLDLFIMEMQAEFGITQAEDAR